MAAHVNRLGIDGYGQLELNNVAFRRDGRIEAQCKLNTTSFPASGSGLKYAENGMLLAVDNVAREIKLPVADGTDLIAINYTTEHMYDDRENALKDFKLASGENFLPRLGYLSRGDKFTTNCIVAAIGDDAADEFANDAALKATVLSTTPLYGCEHTSGAIYVTKVKPTTKACVLKAVKMTTMPDGQFGIKFQVL